MNTIASITNPFRTVKAFVWMIFMILSIVSFFIATWLWIFHIFNAWPVALFLLLILFTSAIVVEVKK